MKQNRTESSDVVEITVGHGLGPSMGWVGLGQVSFLWVGLGWVET